MTQTELFLRLELLTEKQLHRFSQLCNAGITPSQAVCLVKDLS